MRRLLSWDVRTLRRGLPFVALLAVVQAVATDAKVAVAHGYRQPRPVTRCLSALHHYKIVARTLRLGEIHQLLLFRKLFSGPIIS